MNFFHNKNWFLNLVAIVSLTVATSYVTVNKKLSMQVDQVQFINLTNADIDKILAVKAEMQAAKIQANLSF